MKASSMVHNTHAADAGTSEPRAVHAGSPEDPRAEQGACPNPAERHYPRAVQDPAIRSTESLRAEEAYRDWASAPPAERPLAHGRLVSGAALFAVLRDHGMSNSRFAAIVGVDEKTVRQWLDGTKPLPLAVLTAMPADMGQELADRIFASRSARSAPRRLSGALRDAGANLRDALSLAESDPSADAPSLMQAAIEIQGKLGDVMRALSAGRARR